MKLHVFVMFINIAGLARINNNTFFHEYSNDYDDDHELASLMKVIYSNLIAQMTWIMTIMR